MPTDHLSLSTAVALTPRRAGLSAGTDNTIEILVRVQAADAPSGDAADRAPQAIALVIDRSGSMDGRPLAEARRCAEHVVGSCGRRTPTFRFFRRSWPKSPRRHERSSITPSLEALVPGASFRRITRKLASISSIRTIILASNSPESSPNSARPLTMFRPPSAATSLALALRADSAATNALPSASSDSVVGIPGVRVLMTARDPPPWPTTHGVVSIGRCRSYRT